MSGMTYVPADDRYEQSPYRRCGRSGIQLPAISLGLWNNFGDDKPLETMRAMLRRAFDRGICHFDLANNYGPPPGSAEINFGRILREDLAPWRDELIISTKAGYDMWQGPYGEWGSRKYLLASLDQSLQRMGLDYVDIFYSHRLDPDTPLEETMGALDTAVRQGKALYAGISSYSGERTREAVRILRELGTPLLIHQPSYSMLNRWVEEDLLDVLEDEGVGCIAFSPLAQGMLTTRYLDGVPEDSRAAKGVFLSEDMLTEERLDHVRALNDIAQRRGQTLAQMAVAWVLRDPRVTSALIGASSVAQLDDTLGALDGLDFSDDELREIDEHAVDAGINLWESVQRARERSGGAAPRRARHHRGWLVEQRADEPVRVARVHQAADRLGGERARCARHRRRLTAFMLRGRRVPCLEAQDLDAARHVEQVDVGRCPSCPCPWSPRSGTRRPTSSTYGLSVPVPVTR